MAEYVNRDLVFQMIKQKKLHLFKKYWVGIDAVFEGMVNLPIADVAPVVHANWIERFDNNDKWLMCSNCHGEQEYRQATKYCPNCGARMDGE